MSKESSKKVSRKRLRNALELDCFDGYKFTTELYNVCDKLTHILDLRHYIPVHVYAAKRLYTPNVDPKKVRYCWACYDNRKPEIHIAGEHPFYATVDSLIHELVHYEQYRDQRKPTELGVEVRARNILKQLKEMK